MKWRSITLGLGAAIILGATVLPPPDLVAQSQGDMLEFVVSTSIDVIRAGDIVVFTGVSQGTVDVNDCKWPTYPGEGPLQSAVLIDPSEQRASRIREIIVTSQDRPVRPGTRVGNLRLLGTCAGSAYTKYEGIVE